MKRLLQSVFLLWWVGSVPAFADDEVFKAKTQAFFNYKSKMEMVQFNPFNTYFIVDAIALSVGADNNVESLLQDFFNLGISKESVWKGVGVFQERVGYATIALPCLKECKNITQMTPEILTEYWTIFNENILLEYDAAHNIQQEDILF